MQKCSLWVLALLAAAFIVTACNHDHDHDEDDTNAPVLTLEGPTEDISISGEVHIHGKVTDEGLHEMEIKVTRDSDNSEIFKAKPKVYDKTEYSFDERFTPTIAAETPVTLTITVEDHGSNKTAKTVKFKLKS